MSVGTNIQTINFNKPVQQNVQMTFRSQTVPVTDYPPDAVEINSKKKGLSKGAKWGIGIVGTITTIIGAMCLVSRHQIKKTQQLIKEKLVPKVFDKKIEFKEAKSLEDAIRYAKETLGIKEVDNTMPLDVVNFVNKNITDVVNKNTGQKVFIPQKVKFTEPLEGIEGALAFVDMTLKSKGFGELCIIKDQFMMDSVAGADKTLLDLLTDKTRKGINFVPKSGEIRNLYKRYQKGEKLLPREEWKLYLSLQPQKYTKGIDWLKFAEENRDKIDINLEELRVLEPDKRLSKLQEYLRVNNKRLEYQIDIDYGIGQEIYHELGHLQDAGKNLENTTVGLWEYFNIFRKKSKDSIKNASLFRWYTKDQIEQRFKNPDTLKCIHPDIYEFLYNEEIQKTAGKVSEYSKVGIGEFIAETYARMIEGKTLPEDVIVLYKKYNGPIPNGFK